MQCSQPSLFSEIWQTEMFMTPLFGLIILWLPEMRMRQLWIIAMRQPRMPQTTLVVTATTHKPLGNKCSHPGTGWMGCVFLFGTY